MKRPITTKQISDLVGVTMRAAQYWLSGRVKPGPLARTRLEQLGIRIELPRKRRRRR